MKHIQRNILYVLVLIFLSSVLYCEKTPSPHLQNALLLMKNKSDYSDPVFEEVLRELRLIEKKDPNYARAQVLIARIESVRKHIFGYQAVDAAERRQREEELEKERAAYEKILKSMSSRNRAALIQSDAEKALNMKLAEMYRLEQQIIEEQNRAKRPSPTVSPNPFIFTPTDDRGRNEQYWQRKNNILKNQLTNLKNTRKILQDQLNHLNTAGLPRHKMLQNDQKRKEILNRITRVERQIESKKKEIDNLKDDLRKAGGMPGWIR